MRPGLRGMKAPTAKQGFTAFGVDGLAGNRVEETIYAHVLILPGDGSLPSLRRIRSDRRQPSSGAN